MESKDGVKANTRSTTCFSLSLSCGEKPEYGLWIGQEKAPAAAPTFGSRVIQLFPSLLLLLLFFSLSKLSLLRQIFPGSATKAMLLTSHDAALWDRPRK